MRTRSAAMAAALLLLSGPLDTARAEAASAAAAWSGSRWWLAYDDPQLQALIAQGLSNGPRMAGARAKVRRAEAIADGARAAGRPGLMLQGAATRFDVGDGRLSDLAAPGDGRAGGAGLGLALSQDLDLWGKTRAQTAAAGAEARGARADADATALTVSVGIARAYGDLAARLELRDVLQRAVVIRQDMLAAARRRADAGAAPASDVQSADVARAQAAAELAACDEAIARAQAELALWTGAEPTAMAQLTRPRLQVPDTPADDDAEAGGPELAAARERTTAADHRVAAARTAYLPSLRLLALAGAQLAGANALLGGEGVGAIGSALQLPILDGGRRRAGVRLARAERDLAVAVRDETRQRYAAEAFAASAAHRALMSQLVHQRAALAASTGAWEGQRQRFKAGDVDSSAVLSAEDRVLAESRRLLALEARRFQLELDLVQATGGGWREAAVR